MIRSAWQIEATAIGGCGPKKALDSARRRWWARSSVRPVESPTLFQAATHCAWAIYRRPMGAHIRGIAPTAPGREFPGRDDLPSLPVQLVVYQGGEEVFAGPLTRGGAAEWPGRRLVLEDLDYWLGLQVVSERGGGLLITGFIMGILGLIWRLLLYRREVAVLWDGAAFSWTGRSEYLSWQFKGELSRLGEVLKKAPAAGTE